MPRIYELRDLIEEPSSPNAYFQHFDENVGGSLHVREIYIRRERDLQGLDCSAWEFLKAEARPYLVSKASNGRGWQQLFDFLNQARAYNYLKSIGCSRIRFIPRAAGHGLRTPDLEAVLGSESVLCEVKTINISQNEVRARQGMTARTIAIRLDAGFFQKLGAVIADSVQQMQHYGGSFPARRYVYINICFDDFLAQCKEDYFSQIDQYLSDCPVSETELVFHNDRTAFYKALSMKNASVVNESED